MKQWEAVILALERLGGQATLPDLYRETMKVEGCTWKTRTPYASIRRIVQTRPEIFRVRPGLWALRSYSNQLGLQDSGEKGETSATEIEQGHSYYQGLLVIIGNLRGFSTFVPHQDKNKSFLGKPLGDLRTLQSIPVFSHDFLVKRSETIDVIWFNARLMPDSLFEVEHSTDMQNAFLKFYDLEDFHARMVIVADGARRREFESRKRLSAFQRIAGRVSFLDYQALVRQYEYEVLKSELSFLL